MNNHNTPTLRTSLLRTPGLTGKLFLTLLALTLLLLPGKSFATCTAKASFTYTVSGNKVSFTDASKPVGAIHYWKFGDGDTSYNVDPKHTYSSSGTFKVTLLVYDTNGTKCYDTVSKFVIISSKTCHASFKKIVLGNRVYFLADSSVPSTDKITWNYGDGNTGSGAKSYHVYTKAGTYAACMYIYDSANSCHDTACTGISLKSCGASFTTSASGLKVTFGNNSYVTSGSIHYLWKFGDGTSDTTQFPSHTYASGTTSAHVKLYIANGLGCYDSADATLTFTSPSNCEISVTYSVSGLEVTLTPSVKSGSTVTGVKWTFGDGSGTTGSVVKHTYGKPGSYYVSFTSYNTAGCSHTDSILIKIYGTYDLNGNVFIAKSKSVADYAKVYLIYFNPTDSTLKAIDSTSIKPSDTGRYHFGGVKPGKYLVKAALTKASSSYSSTLPTYHTMTLHWDSAKAVIVSSAGVNGVGIYVIAGSNPGGAGFIGGKVAAGANKKGDPLPNVLVILYDGSNNPVSYTYSDANGNYGFDNLAYGSYVVYPEVLDKSTNPGYVTISTGTPSITTLTIEVGTSSVTTGIMQAESVQSAATVQLFPNPVHDVLNLSVESRINSVSMLNIYDATGRRLLTKNIELSAGKQQIQISTDELPGGIYILQMEDAAGTVLQHYRFVKSKD